MSYSQQQQHNNNGRGIDEQKMRSLVRAFTSGVPTSEDKNIHSRLTNQEKAAFQAMLQSPQM
ncbi:MAG TPA: hypothetical protein DCM27_06820 [Rhodospirillaceae bacterium]|nr:hypothetical protein [Rhodospirillaceae bacterium]